LSACARRTSASPARRCRLTHAALHFAQVGRTPRQQTGEKVVAGNLRLYVVIAAVALYAGALAAPAIIFKPDARSNPKHGECGFAVKDNVSCEAFRFGGSGSIVCQLSEFNKPGKTYVDKGKILDYCKDWDLPVADSYYGYQVLPMGILAVFRGMFG